MSPSDLETLLRDRLGLQRVRRSGSNIMACCPAHADSRPSWGISISPPHLHGCFSCGFKGSLLGLLIHKGWTITDANNLIGQTSASGSLSWGAVEQETKNPSEEELWPFVLEPVATRYMLRRGISFSTLKKAEVVYHRLDNRVMFPWFVNRVFRGATGRSLDPHNPARIQSYWELDKRSCLYIPMNRGVFHGLSPVVLVEGEIDALTVMQCGGYQVAALGKGSISSGQVALIESLPVNSEIILCFDSDKTGRRLTQDTTSALLKVGRMKIRSVSWASFNRTDKRDANSVGVSRLRRMLAEAKPVKRFEFRA